MRGILLKLFLLMLLVILIGYQPLKTTQVNLGQMVEQETIRPNNSLELNESFAVDIGYDSLPKKSIVLTLGKKDAEIIDEQQDRSSYMLDLAPYTKNEVILVPLRFVGESLGLYVDWNKEIEEIILTDNRTKILMTLNSNLVYVNDEAMLLDLEPEIVQGTTIVPLSFIKEELNVRVIVKTPNIIIEQYN